ncbi:MAG: B12-binding domain-containing radical SAM protein [Patescibacteria group bacterium]|nr:B12-binding domain-containing radical SAM protein [Patescibacteria group bacterium]
MGKIERGQQIEVATLVNVPAYSGSKFINSSGEPGKGSLASDVYSHITIPSLGMANIHGVLEKTGLKVESIDPRCNEKSGQFTDLELAKILSSDLVGFTSMTRNRESTIEAATWIKRQANLTGKDITVVAGGIDPSFTYEEWLKRGVIDYIVIGEGEKTAKELVQSLKNGTDPQNIKGIAYLRDGNIIKTEKRELLTQQELSYEIPLPIYPENIRKNSRIHIVSGSRGCRGACDFCSVRVMWGGVHRRIDPKRVIEEIKLGDGKITFFSDDSFLPPNPKDREGAKQLMREIINVGLNDRIYSMQLDTPSAQDKEAVNLAVKMGAFFIFLAIESMDQETLRGMRKAATVQQNFEAIKTWRKHGCYVHALNICGIHGKTTEESDSPEKLEEQKRWLIKDSGVNSAQLFIETPLPGSDLAKRIDPSEEAIKDTTLYDLQHSITKDHPPGFTSNYDLQKEVDDFYKDFYSLKHIPRAIWSSIMPLFPLNRALIRVTSTIATRIYAHRIIEENFKDPRQH